MMEIDEVLPPRPGSHQQRLALLALATCPPKNPWPISTNWHSANCAPPATSSTKSPTGPSRAIASTHNLKYWRREPYLGFGAGAHSFSGNQRWANLHDAAAYVSAITSGKSAIEDVQSVTSQSALEEELFLGLRQLAGIDLARIQRQYGVDLKQKVDRLASTGMVEQQGDVLRLAPAKLNVSNEILVELLR